MIDIVTQRGNLDLQTLTEGRPCEDAQEGDGRLQAKETGSFGIDPSLAALRGNQPCQHLDLGLLASRTTRNEFLLFKPHSLWYFFFLMTALEN